MKNSPFAVLLVMILTIQFFAQVDDQIASIRAEVDQINKSARRYTKKVKPVDDVSLEGAEATFFLSGKGLKKANVKIFGETFRATAELYFSGEELIFAYQRLERYDTHVAADPPPKVAKVIETRVYYSGAKAIRVIDGKKQLAAADDGYSGAVEGMTELSEKVKAALKL